jgi:pimeloyl-ACP methyl ester carboxylesterase
MRRRTGRVSRDVGIRSSRALALALLIGVLPAVAACATPIGVTVSQPEEVHRAVTRSVLTNGKPSHATEQFLHRLGLVQRFDEDPVATLQELRGTGAGLSRDRLFALAELSFIHAQKENRQDYYLASAVYAYAFLFRKDGAIDDPLDSRTRLAADLYNFGLGLALAIPAGADGNSSSAVVGRTEAELKAVEVDLADRTLPLPFGRLELRGDAAERTWGGLRMNRFISVGEFNVRGLRNRYRQPGIGAALAGEVSQEGSGPEAEIARKYIPARVKVPLTALVRIPDVMQGIADGQLQGRLDIYPADADLTVEVEGRKLPLEQESSVVLAYALEGAPVWDTEFGFFLSPGSRKSGVNLYMIHPYRPGRIPIVLVHGTASSPARWADMINELQNDPLLRTRIQFWLFTYSTSNPILLSASELRHALEDIVTRLDPNGLDPALRRMVLIGHSQGGLLARLMVTESGDRFWHNVSRKPFDQIKGPPEALKIFRDGMFFEPVPTVKRVVFIATPHHGSFRVSTLVRDLVGRVVTLPVTLGKSVKELAAENPDLVAASNAVKNMPTAVDNMRPGNPFVKTLAASPINHGVAVHSIVAVLGPGPVAGKTDGVVAYESAHLTAAESEKIVRSSHSCQSEPDTILEVRRILLEHLATP